MNRSMKALKNAYSSLSRHRKIIVVLLLCLTASYALLICVDSFLLGKRTAFISALPSLFIACVVFLLIPYRKIKVFHADPPLSGTKKEFLQYFLLCFAPLLLVWITTFPGNTSNDTAVQWQQVTTFTFDSWHPIAHTFLIWLSTLLVRRYWFALFVQDLALALAAAYMVVTLKRWGVRKLYLYIAVLMMTVNPATWQIVTYLWKDVAFAIFVLLLTAQCINIYLSGGKWLKSFRRCAAFTLVWLGASLMRHNAIFFTIPALFMLLILYRQYIKQGLCLAAGCILLLCLVEGPIYAVLDSGSEARQTYTESVGIPMTILGEVVTAYPERLSEETKAFLYQIASQDEWETYYKTGSWNSVKQRFPLKEQTAIESVAPLKLLQMTWQAIKAAPGASVRAVLALTEMVWNPFSAVDWKLSSSAASFLDSLFWCPGMYMLPLFVLLAAKIRSLRKDILLFLIPIVTYNFGTMLLLCGTDWRFFYYNLLILVPVACMFFARDSAPDQSAFDVVSK